MNPTKPEQYEIGTQLQDSGTLPPEPQTEPKQPYCCPVCGGRGKVPAGFYDVWGKTTNTTNLTDTCRTCGGTGIVWE